MNIHDPVMSPHLHLKEHFIEQIPLTDTSLAVWNPPCYLAVTAIRLDIEQRFVALD